MFSFGACPAGYRRDCIHRTCLARHIDDDPKVSYTDAIQNMLQNSARYSAKQQKRQKQRKSYGTRSTNRKRSSPGKGVGRQFPRMADIDEKGEEWEDGDNIPKTRTQKLNGCFGKSSDYVATGLDNLRNTCYMNSVLQCLAGTEQIMEIIGDSTVIAPEGSIYNELKLLLTAITSGEYERITPLKFKKKVDEHLGLFADYRQHDAHDFMCSLLEQLDKEVNLTNGFLNIITGATEVKRRCTNCNKGGPPMEDPFTSLHIEFKDNNMGELNVEEAIEDLQKTEKFACPCLDCGGNESEKQTSLTTLPEILTLQIKRFVLNEENLKLTKNHTDVAYPREMKLGDREYELYASINHSGELMGGHYVTFSKQNVTDKWFCYNDNKTREVKITAKEKSSEVYILFYRMIKQNDVGRDVTEDIDKDQVETIHNGQVDGSPEPLSEESLLTEMNLEENIPCELDESKKAEENSSTEETKAEENTPTEETATTTSNTRDGITIQTGTENIEVDCQEEIRILVEDTIMEDTTRIGEADHRADSATERDKDLYIQEMKKAIVEKKDSEMKTRIEEIKKAEKAAIELVKKEEENKYNALKKRFQALEIKLKKKEEELDAQKNLAKLRQTKFLEDIESLTQEYAEKSTELKSSIIEKEQKIMSMEKQINAKKDIDGVPTDRNTNKNTKRSDKIEDSELLDSHDEQEDEMKKNAPDINNRNRNERNLEKRKCYNCNNKGHIAADCPNKNISKWCTYCSKKNHNTDECWSAKRNDRNLEDTKESEETEEVTCGICKKKGHCTKEHIYSQQNRRDQQRTAGRENWGGGLGIKCTPWLL